jgi:hypothetical protein
MFASTKEKRKQIRRQIADFCFGKSCVTCPLDKTRVCEWDIVNDAKITMAKLEKAERIINEVLADG